MPPLFPRRALGAAALAAALLFTAAPPSWAEVKSFTVRGRKVELQLDTGLIVVRPKGEAKTDDLTKAALNAQARLLGRSVGPAILQLAKNPPKTLPHGHGVVMPRLSGVRAEHLARVAGMSDSIGTIGEVYRLGDQLVVPTGTLTVRFKSAPTSRFLAELAADLELEEVSRPRIAPHLVRFRPMKADADLFALCETLAARAEVRWAEPGFSARVEKAELETKTPNDPLLAKQWHLKPGPEGINLPQAWAISTGGAEDFIVAVIDDGVDLRHEDLVDHLLPGYDFYEMDDDPTPDPVDSHGTACAGLIGAVTDNGLGVAGVCWKVKILPIRIAASDGWSTDDAVAEAFHFARERGARVISCSWSYGLPVNIIADAVDEAYAGGCLILGSSSNKGNDPERHYVHFPAALDSVMAVGAVRPDNLRWSYSCYGPELSICAPSSDSVRHGIWTADHTGEKGYNPGGEEAAEPSGNYCADFGGTSAACPITAGVAALVWSTYPELTAVQVRELLEGTATKIDPEGGKWEEGHSPYYGYGKVDALAALTKGGELARAATRRVQGGPPFPSNFYVPKAIEEAEPQAAAPREQPAEAAPGEKQAAAARRLETALAPRKGSYEVRGERVELEPDTAWMAVELDLDPAEGGSALWSVVKAAKEEVLPRVRLARDGPRRFAVIPSTLLHAPERLRELLKTEQLPPLFPVYRRGDSQAVLLGEVQLRAEDEQALEAVTAAAAERGLVRVDLRRGVARFALSEKCELRDPFEAIAALAESPGVVWCEPRLVIQITKIGD